MGRGNDGGGRGELMGEGGSPTVKKIKSRKVSWRSYGWKPYILLTFELLSVLGIRIRRIRMFLGLPDPDTDPVVRGADPDPSFY
jgi:hypothetical protein